MSDLLRAQDVYVSFYTAKETVRVLNGFSFSVQPGDIIGLVGESGSGKSVAISAMIALLGKTGKIDSGEILFKGQNVLALNEEQLRDLRCREIGVIPNNPKGMLHPIVPIGTQLENPLPVGPPHGKKRTGARTGDPGFGNGADSRSRETACRSPWRVERWHGAARVDRHGIDQ